MSVIKQVCDKVTVLDQGKMVLDGKVQDVFVHKHDKLNEILGGGNRLVLPNSGVNIRIIVSEEEKSKKIISSAQTLNIDFSIPAANIEQFKDNIVALFVINTASENYNTVTQFLDNKKISWEVVDNE